MGVSLETSFLDLKLVRQLRHDGILRDFDAIRSQDPTQMVIVDCADGSRKLEVLLHHFRLAQAVAGEVQVDDCIFHNPSLNGGALLLHPNSPLVKEHLRQDMVLLDSIEGGIKFKGLDQDGKRPLVMIYTHTPCAAATANNLNIVEQMSWLVKAKQWLKMLFPSWRVLCTVHIFKPAELGEQGKSRSYSTYVFSIKDFAQWLERNAVLQGLSG